MSNVILLAKTDIDLPDTFFTVTTKHNGMQIEAKAATRERASALAFTFGTMADMEGVQSACIGAHGSVKWSNKEGCAAEMRVLQVA